MDELVHHCLRELSFDGALGCNVSRLGDFIVGFYASQSDHTQLVDDAFCAFVWSVIVQQPSVRVGTLPPGMVSEVYIAPQTSARRKAAARGEQVTEGVPPSLELVRDAPHRCLDDLKRQYGDSLRIAVDPQTSFSAITGSHIRPSKLSPMVYSALQLITRGREDGITTVQLGRKTGYDQKTCFYLIKQLVELGLIIKARRGGVGNHTCIHKYFVERSPLWQQIQEEEARNGEAVTVTSEPIKPHNIVVEVADEVGLSSILFDSIDSRHLSSLPLVKNRIIKLLKTSKDHIHQSNNLLTTIGFVSPTKTDRRFFQTRLRELIQQGVIERVMVPSSKTPDRTIKCIRLVTSENRQLPEGSVVMKHDVDDDDKDASAAENASVGQSPVKATLTIHKQVSDMLEKAGPSGLTLNEICAALGNFDKRTIELLLTRAANSRPPPHLADLGTVDLMETYGRERRHRYFTLAAYKCMMASEQLQDTTTSVIDIDLSRVGGLSAPDPKCFYPSTEMLHAYQDSFKAMTTAKGKKRQRNDGSNEEESEPPPKRKRGRPRKTPVPVDTPMGPPKKRGRPRKYPLTTDGEVESVPSARPPSKWTTEMSAEGDGQVVAKAKIPPAVHQVEQNVLPLSSGSFVTEDSNLRSGMAVDSNEQPVHPPPSVGASEECHAVAGTSRSAFEERAGGMPSRRSTTTTSPCSKPARLTAPDTARCLVAEPRNIDAVILSGTQLLERDSEHGEPSASIAQGVSGAVAAIARREPPSPSHDPGTGEKRKDGISAPSLRPSKRSRADGSGKSRSSVNISSLRRENELLKVIESMGGIVNIHAKDIFEAHTTLIDTMSQAKEPTSAPAGTRLDKRTAESTLKGLEDRGRIRMLKTSLVSSSGATRPACLVYLPDTLQGKINDFLRQLSQSVPSTTTEPQVAQNVSSIPRPAVDHSTVHGKKVAHGIKRKRKAEEAQSIEAKSALHKKAEEAHAQRERDWDNLLRQIHPETAKGVLAVRLRAVRSRFLQSTFTKDQLHWENKIQEAIQQTQLASKRIISQRRMRLHAEVPSFPAGPPPVVTNSPEKSVDFLIAQQGPPITQTVSVKKKGKAKEEAEASKRPRFHWTREFDELARDASAVIRARCRGSRLDLSAFDQVFPAVPRNSVRQRITHLRENATEDLYMKRLEDRWYAVWLQHRGAPYLPDENPSSPSNFNLINHVDFLRRHVDKNALRVGFLERETPSKLVGSVRELHEFYEIAEDVVSAPAWEFMWGMAVEEGREKQFRSQAFTKEPDSMHEGTKDEKVLLAEAGLKMVFGTPGELYDTDGAAALLHSVGEECVSIARSNLLHQGVLSKLVRDPKKPKPGRMLKISDSNLNGLGGPFPRDLFQDANSLEDIIVEKVVDEIEWSLIASEGDVATLLQLVSEDQVDFTLDLSQSRAARSKIDWNSKRADDEDIENSIRLKFSCASPRVPEGNQDQGSGSPVVDSDPDASKEVIHGMTLDGKEAACTLGTETGLINCTACIDTAFSLFTCSLRQSDRELARRILDQVRDAKEAGVDKAACLAMEAGLEQHIFGLVHKMTLTSPPILFWRYFVAPVIVAGDYWGTWAALASDRPLALTSPRRWLDLGGFKLDSAWRAAQQAVVGVIFLHPGISQAELQWRLRTVYDRQEVIDILSSLQEDNILECRVDADLGVVQSFPGWLRTLDNEEAVFWFILKDHHWYQL